MSVKQVTMKFHRGTSAQWTSANPTLAQGEPAYETDTKRLKVGDGSTAYNSLDYVSGTGGGASYIIAASDSSASDKSQADVVCSGTDDQSDFRDALDSIGPYGRILSLPGNYNFDSTLILTSADNHKILSGSKSILKATTDTELIHFNNSNYVKFNDFMLRPDVASYNSSLLKLRGIGNKIVDCHFYGAGALSTSNFIELYSGSWFNVFDRISASYGTYAPTFIYLNQNSTSGIQANSFLNFMNYAGGKTISFNPYGNTYTGRNSFMNFLLEASASGDTKTTIVAENISGPENTFINIQVMDLAGDADGCTLDSDASYTKIIGGTMSQTITDNGSSTYVNDIYNQIFNNLKSGTDQSDAGASAGELYVDTNDDNTVKRGV